VKDLVLIVDTREQRPFQFQGFPCSIVRAALPAGDYSLPGFEDEISIERKSLDDLVNCLCHDRERFERELAKLRTLQVVAVVVEAPWAALASGHYRSRMHPNAALETVSAFMVRYRVPFLFVENRAAAERLTYSILSKYAREIRRRAERLEQITATRGEKPSWRGDSGSNSHDLEATHVRYGLRKKNRAGFQEGPMPRLPRNS